MALTIAVSFIYSHFLLSKFKQTSFLKGTTTVMKHILSGVLTSISHFMCSVKGNMIKIGTY